MSETDFTFDAKWQPLGKVLRDARESRGWTRMQLEKKTGIRASSIVRYEKCGILDNNGAEDEDAQKPPVDKLALLCIELNISPSIALASCIVDKDKQFRAAVVLSSTPHMMSQYIEDQFSALLRDQYIWRDLYKHLFGPKPKPNSQRHLRTLELIGMAKQLFQAQEKFEQTMLKTENITKFGYHAHIPLSPNDEIEELSYSKRIEPMQAVNTKQIAAEVGCEDPEENGDWHDWIMKGEYRPYREDRNTYNDEDFKEEK